MVLNFSGMYLSYTSASLRSADKHTPCKAKRIEPKINTHQKLPKGKKTNALASKVGVHAEPRGEVTAFKTLNFFDFFQNDNLTN